MESSSKGAELVPAPPPYFLSGSVSEQDVRVYSINSPYSASLSVSDTPLPPRPKPVSYETELFRFPALTTCAACQTQVTTEVTFKVGIYTWLVCLVFVLCGLIFGCCLIPFFVNHFKDAYHTCPHCRRVLHIQKRTCYK